MNALIAASAVFFFLHLLPGTPLRARFIALAGEQAYQAVFAIAAAAAVWWMVSSFNTAPYGYKLWTAPAAWQWLKAALILFAYILIICGIFTPNPYTASANILEKAFAGGGVFAITRHPLMWGITIWALTHLASQPNLRGLMFFGSFAATALLGSWLQQRRKRAGLPGWAAFEAKTSFWPFAAILEGRATLSLGAIGWWKAAAATAIWALLLYFHLSWFGAQPLPL